VLDGASASQVVLAARALAPLGPRASHDALRACAALPR
jgi:hypothetical protein